MINKTGFHSTSIYGRLYDAAEGCFLPTRTFQTTVLEPLLSPLYFIGPQERMARALASSHSKTCKPHSNFPTKCTQLVRQNWPDENFRDQGSDWNSACLLVEPNFATFDWHSAFFFILLVALKLFIVDNLRWNENSFDSKWKLDLRGHDMAIDPRLQIGTTHHRYLKNLFSHTNSKSHIWFPSSQHTL